MTPAEEELLTGMGNCFEACHADFAHTVEMVSGSRQLTPKEVTDRLRSLQERFHGDARYEQLRGRFPAEFPC